MTNELPYTSWGPSVAFGLQRPAEINSKELYFSLRIHVPFLSFFSVCSMVYHLGPQSQTATDQAVPRRSSCQSNGTVIHLILSNLYAFLIDVFTSFSNILDKIKIILKNFICEPEEDNLKSYWNLSI